MNKKQTEQIKALILDKDILECEIEKKDEIIRCARWFCLRLVGGLMPNEEHLTIDVARKILKMIDNSVEIVSFDEFIDN